MYSFIQWCTTLPPEIILAAKALTCGCLILFCFRFFGLAGLYVYSVIGILVANMAVLKQVQFSFHPSPIAVGTVVFTSLFLCSDVINEYYGKKAAIRNIYLGFFGYFLFSLMVFLVLGYATKTPQTDEALKLLFLPAPTLLLASLISYFISQYTDVWIYRFIYKLTSKKYLWMRTLGSTIISSFLDNTIFSLCAWSLFAITPIPLETIFITYIIGATLIRIVLSCFNTLFMCLTPYMKPKNNAHVL